MLKKLGVNVEIAGGRLGHADHAAHVEGAGRQGRLVDLPHVARRSGHDVARRSISRSAARARRRWFGWPDDAKIEELRDAWFATTDAAASKKAADAVQARAFEFVPYIPTAQFILPTAYRTNLSGVIIAPITLLWNVEKR